MATTTTNIGLRKPAKSDYVNVETDIGDNMDLIDGAVNSVEGAVAIIADGNTHAALSSGDYVYIRNHLSLTEGLYKATAAIAQNGTLSSSNVTAITKGIGGQVAELNSRVYGIYYAKKRLTSNGQITYNIPKNASGIAILGGSAPISFGYSGGTTFYTSGLPQNWTATQNGWDITFTRTSATAEYWVSILIFE